MTLNAPGVQAAALVAIAILTAVALTVWLLSAGVIPGIRLPIVPQEMTESQRIHELRIACYSGGGETFRPDGLLGRECPRLR